MPMGRRSAEQRPCPFGDREHGGVPELPLDGDCVEALADRGELPHYPDLVLPLHLRLDRGGYREQSRARLSKRIEESTVDGGLRDMQLLACPGDATFADDGPEMRHASWRADRSYPKEVWVRVSVSCQAASRPSGSANVMQAARP